MMFGFACDDTPAHAHAHSPAHRLAERLAYVRKDR